MEKPGFRHTNPALDKNDTLNIEKIKKLISTLKEKHNLSHEKTLQLIQQEQSFPVSILNKKLTVLESAVKYLKEEQSIQLSEISRLLKRDQRNIWHAFDNSKRKHKSKLLVDNNSIQIPAAILANPKLSALESLAAYLKENFSLSYHQIALIIKRDDRTVWTVYNNARKKRNR